MKFDSVELWCDKKDLWPRLLKPVQRKKIKESIDQYGMKVVSILPDPFLKVRRWKFFDFKVNVAHPSTKMRRDSIRFYNTALDVGRDLDAEVVLALPGAIEQPNMMASKSSFRNHWDRAIDKHGRPRELLTDRGSQFYANEGERKEKGISQFEAYLAEHGIKHLLCRVNHPQTNGKLERFYGVYEQKQGSVSILLFVCF
jgi:hypothetical protein